MDAIVGSCALAVAFFSLLVVIVQTRLLRKSIQTSNYLGLLSEVFSARDSIIENPKLGEIFAEHPKIQQLQEEGIKVQEFFWILKYLSVWENFYNMRKNGVMSRETWHAYVNTLRAVMKTPKIRRLWELFRDEGTYRQDWVNFVNKISGGEEALDPIMPPWKRSLS